jgi:hypothetical protein
MMNKIWMVALVATAMAASGCSKKIWSSDNKLEENTELSRFGQAESESRVEETGLKYEKGKKGMFSFGSEDGIFGRGGRSGSTTESIRGDKLFAGALDVVLNLPIAVANREGGLITTDWKVDPENPSNRYRVNIRISGENPYGKVKVVVLRQKMVGDEWMDQAQDVSTAIHLTKRIRKKAQIARR